MSRLPCRFSNGASPFVLGTVVASISVPCTTNAPPSVGLPGKPEASSPSAPLAYG